jgi:hypothetical protein
MHEGAGKNRQQVLEDVQGAGRRACALSRKGPAEGHCRACPCSFWRTGDSLHETRLHVARREQLSPWPPAGFSIAHQRHQRTWSAESPNGFACRSERNCRGIRRRAEWVGNVTGHSLGASGQRYDAIWPRGDRASGCSIAISRMIRRTTTPETQTAAVSC